MFVRNRGATGTCRTSAMSFRISLTLALCLIFLGLGGLNIYHKIVWEEPTDGVIWKRTPNGITAVKVEANGPAYLAGLKKGDILYKINDSLGKTEAGICKSLWVSSGTGKKMIYA